MDPDPDPDSDPDADPAIFVTDLQDTNKILIKKKVFLLITFFKAHIHYFSKIKVQKKSQNSRSQGFLLFLLDDRRIRIRIHTSD
jgi:hypothetical protein